MLVAPPPRLPEALAQLVRVERDGNPLRRFGHASPFIGKLAALDGDALESLAHAAWKRLPPLAGRTLVIGMTESSLLLSWFLARQAPFPVELRFTTREQRALSGSCSSWRTFEEPHSHGPLHFLALEAGAHFDQMIIVEDELTTGATLRNLVLAIQDAAARFIVVTLSDMRPPALQAQLTCELLDLGLQLHTLDLGLAAPPHATSNPSHPPAFLPQFNPFQRSPSERRATQHALALCHQNFDFGAIYMVGECVAEPLTFWASLPASRRPALQQITRSPWKIDGEAIRSRADFPGDGLSSRYFLYNFASLAPRALIVHEPSHAAVAAQSRDFLSAHDIEIRAFEVATS